MISEPFRLLLLDGTAGQLLTVDGPSGKILMERPLPSGVQPLQLFFLPGSGLALLPVTSGGLGKLLIFRPADGIFDVCENGPEKPELFARSSSDSSYWADSHGDLWKNDGSDCRLFYSPAVGRCCGLAASEQSVFAVWSGADSGIISELSMNGELQWQRCLGGRPTGLTLCPDGRILIPFTAAGAEGEGVFLIDDRKVTTAHLSCAQCARISAALPCHAAASADGRYAFIVLEEHAAIARLNLGTASFESVFSVGRSISRLELLQNGCFAVASSSMFADLSLIDLVNGRLLSFSASDREFLPYFSIIQ